MSVWGVVIGIGPFGRPAGLSPERSAGQVHQAGRGDSRNWMFRSASHCRSAGANARTSIASWGGRQRLQQRLKRAIAACCCIVTGAGSTFAGPIEEVRVVGVNDGSTCSLRVPCGSHSYGRGIVRHRSSPGRRGGHRCRLERR